MNYYGCPDDISLMTRYLDGVTSSEEVRILEDLLRESKDARQAYLTLCYQAECVHELTTSDLALEAYERTTSKVRIVRRVLAAAAVVAFLLALPLFVTSPTSVTQAGSALAPPYADFPVFPSSENRVSVEESPYIAPMPAELRMPWFVQLDRASPRSIPSLYSTESETGDSRIGVVAYLLDLDDTEYCRSMRLH